MCDNDEIHDDGEVWSSQSRYREPDSQRYLTDISWRENDNGTAAIMCDTDLLASFTVQLLSADQFPVKTPPDRSAETLRNIHSDDGQPVTDQACSDRLLSWVGRKWQEQLDTWWLYGGVVFWCSHIKPEEEDQPVLEWFMRFPTAMACPMCAESIRRASYASNTPVVCDSCGSENTDVIFGQTAGMSVIANYSLCRACSGFPVGERA